MVMLVVEIVPGQVVIQAANPAHLVKAALVVGRMAEEVVKVAIGEMMVEVEVVEM